MIGDRKINITKDLERYKSVFEIVRHLGIYKVAGKNNFEGKLFIGEVSTVDAASGITKDIEFAFNPYIDTEV